MKVQLVFLEAHDDLASARDKLGWIKAPRALVIWPKRGKVLQRRLDLELLVRYADQRRVQLGLVTHDPLVRENAADLDIPVFNDLDQLPEDNWRRRRTNSHGVPARKSPPGTTLQPPKKRSASPDRRFAALAKLGRPTLFGLALLTPCLLALALLPWARVTASPETSAHETELTIVLDSDAVEATSAGRVPVRLANVRVSEEMRRPTTGRVVVPTEAAEGTVAFINLTTDPVQIPQGTGLRSGSRPRLRFITLDSASLPGNMNAEVKVKVRSLEPGPAGNLPAEAIDLIEGPLGLQVAVRNPEPLTGGDQEMRSGVAPEDPRQLERDLLQVLRDNATRQLAEMLTEDEVLLGGHLELIEQHEKELDRRIFEPAESLSLRLDVEFQGQIYLPADVEAAAALALVEDLPEGWAYVPASLEVLPTSEVLRDAQGAIAFEVVARQDIYWPIDKSEVSRALRGRTPAEAARDLRSGFGITPVQVILSPGWFPRLPFFDSRIEILWFWESSP